MTPDGQHIQVTPTFSAGNPTKLFDANAFVLDGRFSGGGTGRIYDVSRDGRFLMIKESTVSSERTAQPPRMIVVQNWFGEVKARFAGRSESQDGR